MKLIATTALILCLGQGQAVRQGHHRDRHVRQSVWHGLDGGQALPRLHEAGAWSSYKDEDLKKIYGGNKMRVFNEVWEGEGEKTEADWSRGLSASWH